MSMKPMTYLQCQPSDFPLKRAFARHNPLTLAEVHAP